MKPILFLHIPRTGGIGYCRVLKPAFRREEIREEPPHVNNIPLTKWHETFEHNPEHKFITGHWDWGIVEKIPDVRVITNIRNPIDRCVSSFNHHLNETSENRWNTALFGIKDFFEFVKVKDGYVRMSNVQCRQVSGLRWTEEIDDVNDDVLEIAKQNIDKCFAVNLTAGGLRATPTRKGDELYWNYQVQEQRWNITPPHVKPLDADIIDYIIEMNQFDMKLYEYVRDKWHDQSL